MNKVNFTSEHKTDLDKLFLELSFSGEALSNKFGAASITPYDALHHTSMNTLKSLSTLLKKEISTKEENTDEWGATDHDQRQLSLKKKWASFVHLMIGYKLAQEAKARESKELRELKKELLDLETANQTPEEKLKKLKEKIAEMEGSTPEASADIAP